MSLAGDLVARLAQEGIDSSLLADVAEALFAADIERKALADRREHERVRKAKSRDRTGHNGTARECQGPPKSNNIKPLVSEANASADEPPQDPVKQLFDLGVVILTDAGIGKERARSFVGKLKQKHGAAVVLQALLDCRAKNISAPIDWLEKRFKAAKYVSASGYEYRGDARSVMREAEKRADWPTYWSAKSDSEKAA